MDTIAQATGLGAVTAGNMVISAAHNARAHRRNCTRLAEQVRVIGNLLETLRSTEVVDLPATKEPLDGLEDVLREALELVESCKDRSYMYLLAMGWSVVHQFRQVQSQIDRYLGLVPLVSLVHDFRIQKQISERLKATDEDKTEYTLDEEDKEAQNVILKSNRSKKDVAILEKSLSRRYPDLKFHEALDEEKEKLHVELKRSRTNNDPEQCRVIKHLIEVTNNVGNVLPSKKAATLVNKPTYLISGRMPNNAKASSDSADLELKFGGQSKSKWKTDLFGCCSEPCLCLKTFFYPCGTFSWIANVVTRGETTRERALSDLMAYSILCGCFCYTSCIRRKLRSQFNIEGGLCDDFLTHLICCCCAMVQEWRELEHRGFGDYREKGMTPPPCQYMKP